MNLRVFIVGVDKYDDPSLMELDGPVKDGVQFARWLVLEQKVDPKKIDVFFSRSDPVTDSTSPKLELPEGIAEHRATRQEIRDAFLNMTKESCPEYFCLFWGGHGVAISQRERKLYCADASAKERCAFDVEDFLDFIATNKIGSPESFQKTIVIVDACANYSELSGGHKEAISIPFPKGNPMPQRQYFVIMAARTGEYAENEGGTGLFSSSLLCALKGKTLDDLFDRADSIAIDLKTEFEELKKQGKAHQIPAYYGYQPYGSPRDCVLITANLHSFSITFEQLDELLKITAQLKITVSSNQCIEALLGVRPFINPPKVKSPENQYFQRCLCALARGVAKELLGFLTICHTYFGADPIAEEIKGWTLRIAKSNSIDIGDLENMRPLTTVPRGKGNLVQVVVEPLYGTTKGKVLYKLHLSVRSDKKNEKPFFYQCSEERSDLKALKSDFKEYFSASSGYLDSEAKPTIELALPRELLNCGAQIWEIENGPELSPVGYDYSVAIRSYDRHYCQPRYFTPLSNLKEKWKLLTPTIEEKSLILLDDCRIADGDRVKWKNKDILALCVLKIEGDPTGATMQKVFDSMITAGLPLALWLNSHAVTVKVARDAIKDRFLKKPHSEWLEIAKSFRLGSDESGLHCSDLAVLSDNPDRPLPVLNSLLNNHTQGLAT